jgi:hypothetical protein
VLHGQRFFASLVPVDMQALAFPPQTQTQTQAQAAGGQGELGDGDQELTEPGGDGGSGPGGGSGGAEAGSVSYCFRLLARFLRDAARRCEGYRDELLLACLQLCLSAPPPFIDLAVMAPLLHKALAAGVSHTPTAAVAMDTLERWRVLLPEETRRQALPAALPLLARCSACPLNGSQRLSSALWRLSDGSLTAL